MAKTIMKMTQTEAVVKINGTGTETINLSTDLLSTSQVLQGDLKVGLTFLQWTTGGNISITRGGVEIYKLFTNTGNFDMGGNGGFADYTQSDENIVVSITGDGVIFLTLRKAGGYKSKIEPEYFGQYDDQTKVGE
jgi:hypothetical protein